MGGTVHREQGSTQRLILSYRCTGTEGRRRGYLGRGDEEALECSVAASFLFVEGPCVCISDPLPDIYIGCYAMNEKEGTPS